MMCCVMFPAGLSGFCFLVWIGWRSRSFFLSYFLSLPSHPLPIVCTTLWKTWRYTVFSDPPLCNFLFLLFIIMMMMSWAYNATERIKTYRAVCGLVDSALRFEHCLHSLFLFQLVSVVCFSVCCCSPGERMDECRIRIIGWELGTNSTTSAVLCRVFVCLLFCTCMRLLSYLLLIQSNNNNKKNNYMPLCLPVLFSWRAISLPSPHFDTSFLSRCIVIVAAHKNCLF